MNLQNVTHRTIVNIIAMVGTMAFFLTVAGFNIHIVNTMYKKETIRLNSIPNANEIAESAYNKQKIKIVKGIEYMKENAISEYTIKLDSPILSTLKNELIEKEYNVSDWTDLYSQPKVTISIR